jgi:hypothetical protein
MAFHSPETSENEILTLKTTRGERIDVVVPPNATIEQAIVALVEQHQYHPTTKLMAGREILNSRRHVNEFADGSLLIVGATSSSARHRSPQQSKIRSTHHHGAQSPQQSSSPSHPSASGRSSHQESPTSASTPQRSTTPQPEKMVITGIIPAMNKAITLNLFGHATVADLLTAALSIDARLVGCKLAFRGKFISGSTEKTLHTLGIRDGDTVHIATGLFHDINVLSLYRVEEDLLKIKARMEMPLSELERKALYEELMRVLFRTDDLQELEGELRLRRKDLVKTITAMQDALKPPAVEA